MPTSPTPLSDHYPPHVRRWQQRDLSIPRVAA